MNAPITPPGHAMPVYKAISSDPDKWWSVYSLQGVLARYTGETIARKARLLRGLGLLDWRKVADTDSGGRFVDYRVAKDGPGYGREHSDKEVVASQPCLSSPLTNQTAATDGAGLLFDVPPDPEIASRKGSGIR